VLHPSAGCKDFVVAEWSCAKAGGEVGDAGDAEDFDSHVAGDDGFRDGGHSYQGCAEGTEGEDFGWGFKAGAGDGEVNAFGEREAFGFGGLLGEGAEAAGVGFGHVEKTQARVGLEAEAGLVGAVERVEAHHVDVVAEGDELADMVAFRDASGGVGEDDCAEAERAEDTHGEGNLLWRIALIEMHAPLHDDDWRLIEETGDDAAGVALNGGLWEVGDFGVGNDYGVVDGVGYRAQAGTENDSDFGAGGRCLRGEPVAKEGGCFRDLVEVGHGWGDGALFEILQVRTRSGREEYGGRDVESLAEQFDMCGVQFAFAGEDLRDDAFTT